MIIYGTMASIRHALYVALLYHEYNAVIRTSIQSNNMTPIYETYHSERDIDIFTQDALGLRCSQCARTGRSCELRSPRESWLSYCLAWLAFLIAKVSYCRVAQADNNEAP